MKHTVNGSASMSPEDYAAQTVKDAEAWYAKIVREEKAIWEAYSRRIDQKIAESREELTTAGYDHEYAELAGVAP